LCGFGNGNDSSQENRNMLMQDTLTEYVHEAPEFGYAQAPETYGESDYSRYGSPFGFLRFFNPFARRRTAAAAPPPAPMPGHEMPPPDMPTEPGAGEVAYDGFGNPLGFLIPPPIVPPFLRFTPPQFRFTPPNLSIAPPRVVWSPILRRFVRWVFSPTQRRWIQLPAAPPGAPVPAYSPFRRRWPLGWIRPTLPYTGLGPNRLYMRCAVWPGPSGLVPALAAQTPAAAAAAMGRRRRRRRRR
jgi:hypothetical protein